MLIIVSLFFNRDTVALPCCFSFCSAMKWISNMNAQSPALPIIPLSVNPEHWMSSLLYSRFPLHANTTCIHTYIHIHTCACIYIHTYTFTHTDIYTHANANLPSHSLPPQPGVHMSILYVCVSIPAL